LVIFSFQCSVDPPVLLSFPTRRSSDLSPAPLHSMAAFNQRCFFMALAITSSSFLSAIVAFVFHICRWYRSIANGKNKQKPLIVLGIFVLHNSLLVKCLIICDMLN